MSKPTPENPDHQWTKNLSFMNVEVKVGATWVHMEKLEHQSIGDAREKARKHLKDPSVSAVRIAEQVIKHVNQVIFEEATGASMKIPKSFSLTNREARCPACHKEAQVANNGDSDWVFCGSCNKALPL